jgi:hypothetical protein
MHTSDSSSQVAPDTTAGRVKPKSGLTRQQLAFYGQFDFQSQWEEFYGAYKPSGLLKYRTIWSFVKSLSKDKSIQKMMWWVLGPELKIPEGHAPEFDLPQFDWEARRKEGRWCTSSAIDKISDQIAIQYSGLESMKVCGDKIIVKEMVKLQAISQQLDHSFGTSLIDENLDFEINHGRVKKFLELKNQVLSMMARTQDMHAKANGLNFDDLTGYQHFIAGSMALGNSVGQRAIQNPVENALRNIAEMVLVKSSKMKMPLPDQDIPSIIDQSLTEKKKDVLN